MLHLPNGYNVIYQPENSLFKFGDAYASFSFSINKSNIICSRELYIPSMTIPNEKIGDLKQFIKNIVLKEEEEVFVQCSPWYSHSLTN